MSPIFATPWPTVMGLPGRSSVVGKTGAPVWGWSCLSSWRWPGHGSWGRLSILSHSCTGRLDSLQRDGNLIFTDIFFSSASSGFPSYLICSWEPWRRSLPVQRKLLWPVLARRHPKLLRFQYGTELWQTSPWWLSAPLLPRFVWRSLASSETTLSPAHSDREPSWGRLPTTCWPSQRSVCSLYQRGRRGGNIRAKREGWRWSTSTNC